ncbi:MAG: hypothetical protein CMJ64_28660 [Planctomycetaceae bacterium]|nr:hypothetical protein [Planctomycetaceae bacterium]
MIRGGTLKAFHIIVHGFPNASLDTAKLSVGHIDLQTLVVPSALQSTPLPVTFDQAADQLESFPRLHFEPDGSFVWVSDSDSPVAWQLDGNLYDRGDSVNHVEIKGSCVPDELRRLLDVFSDDDSPLMFELVSLAVFVGEGELLKLVT